VHRVHILIDAGKGSEDPSIQTVRLSICIITYRRPALLAKCLGCITPERQSLDSSLYETIISDDCPDESAREIVQKFPYAHWVKGPNLGVAANRNNVAKAAAGDWLVYVDDDELPEPDWLNCIYKAIKTREWDVIEGRVEAVNLPDSVFWYAPIVRQGGMCCTANLSIRRDFFFLLGGFDETLRTSHEDVEFGERIRSFGARVLFLESALVLHPARKLSLGQLFSRTIQQQCQSYLLQTRLSKSGLREMPQILIWSLKYQYRTLKLRKSIEGLSRWKSLASEIVLRVICCPFALLRLISS